MTIALLEHVVYMLNAFPSDDGISTTLSPRSIVTGGAPMDHNKKSINIFSYAVVYDTTRNNMKSRATPAIALNGDPNSGGQYFMSLDTGKRIKGSQWITKPINQDVINRVQPRGSIF